MQVATKSCIGTKHLNFSHLIIVNYILILMYDSSFSKVLQVHGNSSPRRYQCLYVSFYDLYLPEKAYLANMGTQLINNTSSNFVL